MRKLVGPHAAGSWVSNLDLLRKWQPPLVLVLSPQVDKVQQLRDACPNTIIVGRFYHDDSHYASNINARPKEFAKEIHQEIVSNPVTPLLDYVQSNNETNQDWLGIQRLNQYTFEWMNLADISEVYKCAILAFSVGNPDMPYKPGDPAGFDGRMLYWQQVLESLRYAQNHNHILLMHAYGYPNMFAPDADWYIYRYERQVQANLKTLGVTNLKYAYGEIGIDRLIVNGRGGYKVVDGLTDQGYVNQHLQWERDLQGEDLLLGGAIFTFGDSGGWGSYDIASTNVAALLAEHYASHAGDYDGTDGSTGGNHTVFIPIVGTGGEPVPPTPEPQPSRSFDPRAYERGVRVETPALEAGQQYWFAYEIKYYNEEEADRLGPDHHFMIDVRDENDQRVVGKDVMIAWPTDQAPQKTEAKKKPDGTEEEYATGFGMGSGRNLYSGWVADDLPSEKVTGVGMGAETPSGWNASIHTTTGVKWRKQIAKGNTAVTPDRPLPISQTMFVNAPAGANIRVKPIDGDILTAIPYGSEVEVLGIDKDGSGWWRVVAGSVKGWMAPMLLTAKRPEQQPAPAPTPSPSGDDLQRCLDFIRRWEGEWADDPRDAGGATMRGITIGTYTRWRDAQGLPEPSKEDLRNITDAEVRQIYHDWYWLASGANKLPWPLNLAVVNIAVNGGPDRAKQELAKSGGNFLLFMANTIDWYTRLAGWKDFGAAWTRRNADVLREASK